MIFRAIYRKNAIENGYLHNFRKGMIYTKLRENYKLDYIFGLILVFTT